MAETAAEDLIDLAQFEGRLTPAGQLADYAQRRIRTFWLRQVLVVFAMGTISALVSVWLALGIGLLMLVGEVLDLSCLQFIMSRVRAGIEHPGQLRLALASALVQSLAAAACITICWRAIDLDDARVFAAALLISALISAGMSRPHLRVVADLRLAVFALTGVAMMAMDLAQERQEFTSEDGFFGAAVLLLSFISILFIHTVERTHLERRRNEHALLKHQYAQELAQTALAQRARDSQRLALVAKYARDSIIIARPDGRIEWVNDAFTRITGFSFAEAVGMLPSEILNAPATSPETIARLAAARDNRRQVRAEVLNQGKSGRVFWVDTSIIPIFDEAGELIQWIAVEREITKTKEREAELARARAEAEEAGQAKSRFLANMSHEIRTPMNGVIGVAELLSETRLTKTQRGYVDTILDSGHLLLNIINDILDLAKLQSGKATLDLRPFPLAEAVEAVLRILAPVAAKKGIALRLEQPLALTLLGDEGKFRQILLNLVGNAVKFTQEGGVTVTLRRPGIPEDLLEVEVTDTGIGIAPDRIDRIFDSFSQADNGVARQFGGTGLGLTISAMLAQQMGGRITVHSELGHGSVFTLRVMASLAQAAPATAEGARPADSLRPGLRVLIAEDNRTNMMILRKILKPRVGELIEAQNGAEALELYQARPPDLVLMDVSMPVMDGLQATRDIRAFEGARGLAHCPVVALTANAFGEDRTACRLAGMDGFLVKPLSRSDLLAEIEAHCPSISIMEPAKGL